MYWIYLFNTNETALPNTKFSLYIYQSYARNTNELIIPTINAGYFRHMAHLFVEYDILASSNERLYKI